MKEGRVRVKRRKKEQYARKGRGKYTYNARNGKLKSINY